MGTSAATLRTRRFPTCSSCGSTRPLYFLNANLARGQILDLVTTSQPRPAAILFDLGASADLDVASLDMLKNLVRELDERGVDVLLAQVRGRVRDRLRKAGVMAEIGENRIYLSVPAAVADFECPEPVGLNR